MGAQQCCSSVPDSTSLDINTALLPIYWEPMFAKRRRLRPYESPSTQLGSWDGGQKQKGSNQTSPFVCKEASCGRAKTREIHLGHCWV
ncbi:hypothetical protein ACQKWADRAFT_301770 [Trichoderma austrokoningii]